MKKLVYLFPAFLSVTVCAQNNVIPTPSGDVGLGAYGAPAAKLHVQDNLLITNTIGQSRNILRLAGTCGNNFQNNHWIYRSSSGGDWQTASLHDAISIDTSFRRPGIDTKTWWNRQPAQDIQAWGNTNQTYMILNQGRLGLNFNNPAARLDVQETDNSKMSFIARSAHSIDGTTCIYACVSRDLTQAFLVGQNNYGGIANNWKRTFMVYGNGKTLIGPEAQGNPAHANALLTVSGKIVSKEIIVTNTNWADFVFDSDYSLKPLKQVEQFYKENHHLPDVPSTAEITETGNDLAKTDAILLQKIEELTLYIVELNKKVEKLEKENTVLKKQ